jgi:quinol monooxygenase YgiN
MITFITHLRVKSANAAAFQALMTDMCMMVRKHEPDILYYEFALSAEDPEIFVVVEVYRDVKAHTAHMESEWVQSSLPKSARLIEGGKYDIKQYVSPGTEPVRRRWTAE